MTTSQNLMEIRESQIRAHYDAAFGLLNGFDHTPRIAKPRVEGAGTASERSPGIPVSSIDEQAFCFVVNTQLTFTQTILPVA